MDDGAFFFMPHVPCAPLGRFVQFIWITPGGYLAARLEDFNHTNAD